MQKIKILGFPGNGILTNSLITKLLYVNNENIAFPMAECMQYIERQRSVFPASLTDMLINRTADTITVFEDGKNETISMQWCEVSGLRIQEVLDNADKNTPSDYYTNHSHTTIPLS